MGGGWNTLCRSSLCWWAAPYGKHSHALKQICLTKVGTIPVEIRSACRIENANMRENLSERCRCWRSKLPIGAKSEGYDHFPNNLSNKWNYKPRKKNKTKPHLEKEKRNTSSVLLHILQQRPGATINGSACFRSRQIWAVFPMAFHSCDRGSDLPRLFCRAVKSAKPYQFNCKSLGRVLSCLALDSY